MFESLPFTSTDLYLTFPVLAMIALTITAPFVVLVRPARGRVEPAPMPELTAVPEQAAVAQGSPEPALQAA